MGQLTRIRAPRRCIALAAALLATACAKAPSDEGLARVTIATGPAGTLYNQIGLAVTSVIQREIGTPSTARPFTGTSVYLPQLHRGDLPFGINAVVDTQSAYRGVGAYDRPMPSLRAAMLLLRSPYQFYAKGDSGLRTIGDLRGRAVVVGYRAIASMDRVNAALLATAGLGPEDVRPIAVAGVPDALRSLVDDRAAAAPTMLGIPAVREADATLPAGIRVLGLGPDEAALAAVPGLSAATIEPGPATVGVTEPTRIARIDVYLNTAAHVRAEDVYEVVRTIHRQWTELQQALPALRATAPDTIAPSAIAYPYHEGAVRYFREAGLWTDEHDRRQSELLAAQ